MRKTLLFIIIAMILLSMTSCSAATGGSDISETTTGSSTTDKLSGTITPSSAATVPDDVSVPLASGTSQILSASDIPSFPVISDKFARPGFAAEAGGYTFFTDFISVYRMNDKTGETSKIFTCSDGVADIFEYSGYIFVELYNLTVNRMDFNGKSISVLKDMQDVIFVAEGYIYYFNMENVNRRTINGENDEAIFNYIAQFNGQDFVSDNIGYYKGKVYFGENHKIYSITADGKKAYCYDGDFISLSDYILISKTGDTMYRKDLDTGTQMDLYLRQYPSNYPAPFYGRYIGKYEGYEYYIMDGNLISLKIDGKKLIQNSKDRFELDDNNAVTSNGWIYGEGPPSNDLLKYDIKTKQIKIIAELPLTPRAVFRCKNHLYYIDIHENGLFQIDLSDNSIKQIYSGKMYLYVPMI